MLKKIILMALAIGVQCIAYAGEIKIGVQQPITGKFASEGQGIDNVVRLMVAQINAKGGINGDKFVVETCDDEASPQKAVLCAKTLINDGAKVVVGSYTSTATMASQALYAKAGIIQTSEATANGLMKTHYPMYFRASFNDDTEGEFTAHYFVKVKKYQRVAVLSDYSAFAVGLGEAVVKHVKDLKGNVVYSGKIDASNQDFKAILTAIKAHNPDVIYYSGYYTEGSLLRAQQVELGIKADFVGGNSNDNPEFLKIAGKSAVDSYLIGLPLPSQLDSSKAKELALDYLHTYKSAIPSIWTFINADCLLTVFAAMEATKSNDPKVVAKYIHGGIKDILGNTGLITINEDGERTGSIYQVSKIQPNLEYSLAYIPRAV